MKTNCYCWLGWGPLKVSKYRESHCIKLNTPYLSTANTQLITTHTLQTLQPPIYCFPGELLQVFYKLDESFAQSRRSIP